MKRLLLGGLFGLCLCAQPTVDLEGRYWRTQLGSRIRVDRNGIGTDIDLVNDLGFHDTGFPEGKVTVQGSGGNRLSIAYTPIDFTGDQTVSRTIIFNGQPFTLGTRVVSGLEVKHLQLSWTYQFRFAGGAVRVGPLIHANGFLLSGRLQAPVFGFDANEDFSAGLPTVGLALDVRPHRMLELFGEASGMSAGGYGYFVSSEAGARFLPVRRTYVTAGYRTFNLHIDHTPDFARLRLRGPFVGLGFRL
jgi:hypothetical protein